MKKYLLTSLLASLCLYSIAQKSFEALRTEAKISIDGTLDEAIWQEASVATDFTNWQPSAGDKPSNKTEVRILYSNEAIYLGAIMYCKDRSEVMTQLTERDQVGNTDWFGFVLDTYGNGNEAVEFIVSATGVQFDAKVTNNTGEQESWDEVWASEVTIGEKAWIAELKIPYSALRFPKTEVQSWKINLMRSMPNTGEKCSYQYIDPEVNGFINQTAFLTGVSNIKSPLRLSLSPYVTGYAQHQKIPGIDGGSTGFSYSAGMDLKYGINEAFTLDLTLIPDFGQVQSDDLVLNLSPFEVRYDENRSFFTEGLDLFNKAGLFYSRRVGGTPIGYDQIYDQMKDGESLVNNPSETQLFNATKLSGRTTKGLGVGFFNAISGPSEAEVMNEITQEKRRIESAPLTNYNVVVFDQNLPNNSYISLVNTNVWRKGNSFHNANVSGTEFDLKNKEQTYGVNGGFNYSQLLMPETDNVDGVKYNASLSKISGKLRFDLFLDGTSQNYDSNDLGFNTYTNEKTYGLGIYYNENEGWKSFTRGTLWFNANVGTTFKGNNYTQTHFNAGFWAQTKEMLTWNMWTNFRPESNDYFEPRVAGRFLKRPGFYNMGWYLDTDTRKKFSLGILVFGSKFFDEGAYTSQLILRPKYRINDKFSLFSEFELSKSKNLRAWVDFMDAEPIFGLRERLTHVNVVGGTYTFNNKLSLNLRARHYWSKVLYDDFFGLSSNGELVDSDYNEFNNFSFNLFNVNAELNWRIAPGSELTVVWKNTIFGSEYEEQIDFDNQNYLNGVNGLRDLTQTNSLSVRLVYFINANKFSRK